MWRQYGHVLRVSHSRAATAQEARLSDVPDEAAPQIAAFFAWARDRKAALARPLRRADLSLDQVARWASHLKIIERDAETGDLRVRLFGTGMADIYGRDLTGQTLQAALPVGLKAQLLAGYEAAADGRVVHEQIDFDWPDGKNVRYERAIYPLDTNGVFGQFAVVGVRTLGSRRFFARPQDLRHVASTHRLL